MKGQIPQNAENKQNNRKRPDSGGRKFPDSESPPARGNRNKIKHEINYHRHEQNEQSVVIERRQPVAV